MASPQDEGKDKTLIISVPSCKFEIDEYNGQRLYYRKGLAVIYLLNIMGGSKVKSNAESLAPDVHVRS